MVKSLGFRVQGFRFRVQDAGFEWHWADIFVDHTTSEKRGSGIRVQSFGHMVYD